MGKKKEALNNLNKQIEKYKRDENRIRTLVNKMVNLIKEEIDFSKEEDSGIFRSHTPQILGEEFISLFSHDKGENYSYNIPLIEGLLNSYYQNHVCEKLLEHIDNIWEKQIGKIQSYGDIDYSFTKRLSKKNVRVAVVDDHVCCAEESRFLIIEEKNTLSRKIHIRVIFKDENSDYPEKRYCNKVNLKFWEDREFKVKYDDNLHNTNLGGIYGDCRDIGYVISFESPKGFEFLIKGPEATMEYWMLIQHVALCIQTISKELDNDKSR